MSTRPDPAPGRDPPLIPVPRWDDRDEQRHQKVGSRGGKPRTNTTTSDTTNDDEEDDVTVIAFSMTPTVPLPTFIARELAILIVRTIRRRGADNPDTDRGSRMLEAATGVRPSLGAQRRHYDIAQNERQAPPGSKPATHMRHLAVRAWSLIQQDDRREFLGQTEGAIRKLSSLLERHALLAARKKLGASVYEVISTGSLLKRERKEVQYFS
jgi:hypothetical protein